MYRDLSLEDYIKAGMEARSKINAGQIRSIARRIFDSIKNGGKLVTLGNGGSAADAQHFVAELTGHFSFERRPLAALCLNTNVSSITAIANDYSYDEVFSRQVDALVKSGDVVVGITTSGNSPNVINAIKSANKLGAYTIGMTGKSGGKIKTICNEPVNVESDDTPIIQEMHIAIIHMICLEIDRIIEKENDGKKN
ncbi:MAG: D-sedoheptulose 7-phosphate isomerase [Candidatus Thermoplasmatota archaeon]|nr:D-sedoheptulose 7-phosphate isomerase [Candidatus Thermoplasmatota archaeon]